MDEDMALGVSVADEESRGTASEVLSGRSEESEEEEPSSS